MAFKSLKERREKIIMIHDFLKVSPFFYFTSRSITLYYLSHSFLSPLFHRFSLLPLPFIMFPFYHTVILFHSLFFLKTLFPLCLTYFSFPIVDFTCLLPPFSFIIFPKLEVQSKQNAAYSDVL